MTFIGFILAVVLSFLLSWLAGEFGLLLMGALLFGMIFSMLMKLNQLTADIRQIKRRLGLEPDVSRDYELSDAEIEEELEREGGSHDEVSDEDIERELDLLLEREEERNEEREKGRRLPKDGNQPDSDP
ncbi:hypothetical protein [Paenibacillus flagellatus]|uniref:Uncharacterized protein n=1 Tax=Paenibacillus flagellatus TaxID=2211139 RepID=A0A2V5KUB7_9BACL|nr:hypothetical protein [Paenibacillus flagellatus]PYI55467.1 hypothetical protein DLM86_06955 [Paenibacillus flagellatus]